MLILETCTLETGAQPRAPAGKSGAGCGARRVPTGWGSKSGVQSVAPTGSNEFKSGVQSAAPTSSDGLRGVPLGPFLGGGLQSGAPTGSERPVEMSWHVWERSQVSGAFLWHQHAAPNHENIPPTLTHRLACPAHNFVSWLCNVAGWPHLSADWPSCFPDWPTLLPA